MGRASTGYSGVWEDSIVGAFLHSPRMAELPWKTDSFAPFDLIFNLKKVVFALMRVLSIGSVSGKIGGARAMEKLSPWGVKCSARFIECFSLTLFIWLFQVGTQSQHQGDLGIRFPWALSIFLGSAILVGLGWGQRGLLKGALVRRREFHFWHDLSSQ